MLLPLYPTLVEVGGLFGDVPHEGHLPGLERIFSDADVMATLGGVRPPGAAKAYIARSRGHWREHGFGIWYFRDLETGSFAGWGGLRWTEVEGRKAVELAYALSRDQWGRGHASDIGRLAVQLAFETMGIQEIVGFTRPDNQRSRRVLERLGFRFERPFQHADAAHVLYSLNAGDWAKAI